MARSLRIEYAGAHYHVMSRDNERRPIVRDDADRKKRLDWLRRTAETYGWRLHAFVLWIRASRNPGIGVALRPRGPSGAAPTDLASRIFTFVGDP